MNAARTLHPAYFALVMATGIVSIAAWLQGFPAAARVLLWLNVACYACLWVLTGIRIARHTRAFLADLTDHNRGVGFFTTVAGTSVLGTQLLLLEDARDAAWALFVAATFLWALVTYAVFAALTVKREKPDLARGINGAWLVSVVATQSVAVLASQLADATDGRLLFAALAFWLGGGMLYVWVVSLIFYRYTFFVMEPSDLAPPYWINMGAMAISTLAGSLLVARAPESALLSELAPFLKGFTLFFWTTATWWIPMLVILGVWRHVVRRFPLSYDPLYWGAVFPLGMYSVCTHRMASALPAPFLSPVPKAFFWIALAAWAAAFAGLARRVLRYRP